MHVVLPGATIADAVAGGYALNLPLRVVAGGSSAAQPLVTTDGEGVAIEAVKLADDRSGDVIVRCYESLGGRADAVLRPGFAVSDAELVDLLEDPIRDLAPAGDGFAVRVRPFEIVTVRFRVR